MYSTKTSRSFSTTKQSLDSLPLARLFADFSDVKDKATKRLEERREILLAKEIEAFNTRWSETHESSYEGDYDFLETTVQAKLGDLGDLGSEQEKILEEFGKAFAIPKNSGWFFSQMIARFAQITIKKNEHGYSARQLFLDGFTGKPEMMALLLIARSNARGNFLEKQTALENRDYSALVPLVMSAFKKMHNIGYEEWDRSEIYGITSPNLVEAMTLPSLPEMPIEDVLADRALGLTVKSGTSKGQIRNAATTYGVFVPSSSEMYGLPKLAQIMLCQTWCAHPINRSKYMVLNPLAWDNIPEALISSESVPTATQKNPKTPSHLQDFSWMK